jgi:hypothetical protein
MRPGGVDTVRVGEWSESSVLVQPEGEGSTTYRWITLWRPSRTTMLNWSSSGGPESGTVGAMTLRWARNLTNRQPGLHVDTIDVRLVDGPPVGRTLLDSIWVIGSSQAPVTIFSAPVRRSGRVGEFYADTLRATGGSGGYRWSIAAGALPAGLALDSASGVVSGTPAQPGSHGFTARVRSGDQLATLALTLDVAPVLLTIPTDSIRPAGLMGSPYGDTLRAAGAEAGTVRWHLLDGTLPPGVALDSLTGRLGGVPEAAGSYRFTIEARADTRTAGRTFQVVITRPVLQSAAILDHLLAGGAALTPDQVRFLDLLGNRNGRLDVGDVRAWLADNAQLSAAEVEALRSALGEPQEEKR